MSNVKSVGEPGARVQLLLQAPHPQVSVANLLGGCGVKQEGPNLVHCLIAKMVYTGR